MYVRPALRKFDFGIWVKIESYKLLWQSCTFYCLIVSLAYYLSTHTFREVWDTNMFLILSSVSLVD